MARAAGPSETGTQGPKGQGGTRLAVGGPAAAAGPQPRAVVAW